MLPGRRRPWVTDGTTTDLLRIALEAAVPLWIEKLKNQPVDYLLERARECGQVIAERGDIIQFRSKKKGASAEAFNKLAEGLACAAIISPGGVTFLGTTWTAKPTY